MAYTHTCRPVAAHGSMDTQQAHPYGRHLQQRNAQLRFSPSHNCHQGVSLFSILRRLFGKKSIEMLCYLQYFFYDKPPTFLTFSTILYLINNVFFQTASRIFPMI